MSTILCLSLEIMYFIRNTMVYFVAEIYESYFLCPIYYLSPFLKKQETQSL